MGQSSKTILVVDDEENILELIRFNLERSGYHVLVAGNGSEALNVLDNRPVDLVVLDLMLPDIDGVEICKTIRKSEKHSNLPIIMLTAKSEEIDRILGLELGADDYMTKPFSVKELAARIKTILRRVENTNQGDSKKLIIKNLEIDLIRHEVRVKGDLVELTLKEYDLLKILMSNKGKVLSRNYLLDEVWGYDYFGETRTVDVHIRNIRKKIGDDGLEEYIETVRGVGYKIG
ncbi:two-component system, OmpR family, alkaline phosphatase synthesis response regulator PhoP [Tindallia magadiensis]|uniref:Stage 0 sporulation protein A homolog n=1 Tax=Tindallia magadiensis TaxID=69895 RepID=A0A1I3B7X6_9FIRM|nr:response regulator transcription factor [Tindallia magadiensis]SFH58384.1 two-component system, OmpR family, alkaline phosphatase synthesis response regulator PhoP [Tindallia magadiensis]